MSSKTCIASWSSLGKKWKAGLFRADDGYTLIHYKHNMENGRSYRPLSVLPGDPAALLWGEEQVKTCFDVAMHRDRLPS